MSKTRLIGDYPVIGIRPTIEGRAAPSHSYKPYRRFPAMIKSLGEKHPDTKKASFIAPDSAILGDVTLAEGTSVWYGAVIRGDLDTITIGKNSNVQDNCTLHGDRGYPITLGESVSIGHNAVVHGATVGDNTVIGMGSVLLNGCVIGKNSIVGAGAVVSGGAHFPDGSLIVGIPAKAISELHPVQIEHNRENAETYCKLALEHAKEAE